MKNSWSIKKLSDVCNFEYGTRIVKSRNESGLYYVYGGGGRSFTTKTYNRENRVVVSRFGMSPNCVRKVTDRFYLNDSGLTIAPKSNVILTQKYLDIYIFLLESEIYSCGRGVAQKNLNMDTFSKLMIKFPSVQEQKKIVDKLSSINKAQQLIDAQLIRIEELYESIIDTDLLSKSKLWKIKTIGEISQFVGSGSTPKGGQAVYKTKGIFFIRSQNVRMSELDFSDIVYIDELTNEKMKRTKVYPNDVLLNITGASIGRVAIFPKSFVTANVNQHVCIIRVKEGFSSEYISTYLSTKVGQNQISKLQAGATRQGLNFVQVKSLKIPSPSLSDQLKTTSKLLAVHQYKKKLIYKKALFNELYSSVLDSCIKNTY